MLRIRSHFDRSAIGLTLNAAHSAFLRRENIFKVLRFSPINPLKINNFNCKQ